MRSTSAAIFFALITLPSEAMASDPSGLATGLYIVFVIAPWVLFNLIALAYFSSEKRYSNRRFAVKHFGIASIVPALGILLTLLDLSEHHSSKDRYIFLGIMLGALLLTALPMAVHRFQRHA